MFTRTKLAHRTISLAALLALLPMVPCSFARSHSGACDQFFLVVSTYKLGLGEFFVPICSLSFSYMLARHTQPNEWSNGRQSRSSTPRGLLMPSVLKSTPRRPLPQRCLPSTPDGDGDDNDNGDDDDNDNGTSPRKRQRQAQEDSDDNEFSQVCVLHLTSLIHRLK